MCYTREYWSQTCNHTWQAVIVQCEPEAGFVNSPDHEFLLIDYAVSGSVQHEWARNCCPICDLNHDEVDANTVRMLDQSLPEPVRSPSPPATVKEEPVPVPSPFEQEQIKRKPVPVYPPPGTERIKRKPVPVPSPVEPVRVKRKPVPVYSPPIPEQIKRKPVPSLVEPEHIKRKPVPWVKRKPVPVAEKLME